MRLQDCQRFNPELEINMADGFRLSKLELWYSDRRHALLLRIALYSPELNASFLGDKPHWQSVTDEWLRLREALRTRIEKLREVKQRK